MDRRDFLNPHYLARVTGEALAALERPSPPPEAILLRFARRAMATTFEVVLPFDTADALSWAEAALDLVNRLEDQLTVYHEHSEVSRLNREAWQRAIPVEERLFALLELAARLTRATEGAFDITTGALIKTWGFFRRAGRVPPPPERQAALQRVGMHHLLLDAERRSVRFARPGVELNLGSIGKGYALDRVAEFLQQQAGIASAMLHGGQSSVYALGTMPGDGRGWPVGIRHPWQPQRRLALLRLCNRGMGTSAATFQHLEYNGRKLGHLLDPRTGWPAEGLASATAVAPTAAEADALATAFFILGVEPTRAYCAAHPGIGAVLLPAANTTRPLVLGLAPHEIELL